MANKRFWRARRLGRQITPPFIWSAGERFFQGFLQSDPIEGEVASPKGTSVELFGEFAQDCKVYGEYGSGTSTVWMARNTDATIYSVETAADWVERVRSHLDGRPADIRHVDLGRVVEWGWPADLSRRERFIDYPMSLWTRELSPDLVLIDGRLRVACFLATLLHARPGARIVFDDYPARAYYKVVEEFVTPDRTTNRQALFTVPGGVDRDMLSRELERFRYVLE